jgi:hypothetical protein
MFASISTRTAPAIPTSSEGSKGDTSNMSVILVTYDLNKEAKSKVDYNKFYKLRDSYDYVKLSESSYAFNTTETPQTVYDKLKAAIDPNDHIYIINLKRPYTGFGPQATNDWLAKNLPY